MCLISDWAAIGIPTTSWQGCCCGHTELSLQVLVLDLQGAGDGPWESLLEAMQTHPAISSVLLSEIVRTAGGARTSAAGVNRFLVANSAKSESQICAYQGRASDWGDHFLFSGQRDLSQESSPRIGALGATRPGHSAAEERTATKQQHNELESQRMCGGRN